MILVDSTRSGKRFPDALSKTVPIWCEVVNRAVRLRHHIAWKEDSKLYTPAGTVSAQEHHQIETKIGTWAHELAVRL
jgi:tRNA A64-2'-O-ribosylphosphate transferase